MFTKGDLLWIPSEAILLAPEVSAPSSFRITNAPEIGIYLGISTTEDFFVIVADGQRWVTNKKFVKHLRRNDVSEISRNL